jgi:putative transposase
METASLRTVGDNFDNALAETVSGYYEAELNRGPVRHEPWGTVGEVELATLGLGELARRPTPRQIPR